MTAPEPPSTVASQRIAAIIRDRILAGEYPPGTRIVQDEVAEELGASRLPVREALRILQSTGLVTLRANSGAWVSSLDQRECDLTYRIRERLEPMLLLESFDSLTPEDLTELEDLDRRIESVEDLEDFLTLDRAFHWVTYRRHDAEELATMVAQLWDRTQHYRRAFMRVQWQQRRRVVAAEHGLLVQAVRDEDGEMAQRVLSMHIRRTRVALREHPELFT